MRTIWVRGFFCPSILESVKRNKLALKWMLTSVPYKVKAMMAWFGEAVCEVWKARKMTGGQRLSRFTFVGILMEGKIQQ